MFVVYRDNRLCYRLHTCLNSTHKSCLNDQLNSFIEVENDFINSFESVLLKLSIVYLHCINFMILTQNGATISFIKVNGITEYWHKSECFALTKVVAILGIIAKLSSSRQLQLQLNWVGLIVKFSNTHPPTRPPTRPPGIVVIWLEKLSSSCIYQLI